jgi:hypothetical protein
MATTRSNPGWMVWTGYVLSALLVLMMLSAAFLELTNEPVTGLVSKQGLPESIIRYIAIGQLAILILYAVPRTSVLGAILMAGYLGGATAIHTRILDPGGFIPATLAILAWVGLYLREPRLRELIPLRRKG